MNKIDSFCEKSEAFFWFVSCTPPINLLAGPLKCGQGIVQVVAGLAMGILALPFCHYQEARDLAHFSFKHVIHGIANIVTGAVLTIPIIGNVIAFYAKIKDKCPSWYYHQVNGQTDILDNRFIYTY